jgi:hypothetical protein
MSEQVTKSIENLQPDEWTEHTRIYAGGQVSHVVNIECSDHHEDYGWYTASLLYPNGVHVTSMSAGPIAPEMFTAIVDAWLGQVVD